MMAPHRVDSRKAYLSKAGHANLGDLLGQLTWLWNRALSNRKRAWKNEQRSISLYEQYRHLTATRTDPAWSRFPVKAQRSVLERLDRSYKAFFRKGGFPRFKSEHRGVRSFAIHNPPKVCRAGKWSWVKIKGVGRVKFRGGVPGGDIKLLRLVRTVRRVKIQFVCEREVTIVPDDRPMIGVDLGIKSRIALSNGETVAGVKLERGELKRRQRRLSKAKKGSRNRAKRRRELAREWQRVTEREKGALHELTAELVKRHSASWAVEDLQIPNMVRNRRLSRSIMEQQWGGIYADAELQGRECRWPAGAGAPASHVARMQRVRTAQGHRPVGPRVPLQRMRPGPGPGRERGEECAPEGDESSPGWGYPGTRVAGGRAVAGDSAAVARKTARNGLSRPSTPRTAQEPPKWPRIALEGLQDGNGSGGPERGFDMSR